MPEPLNPYLAAIEAGLPIRPTNPHAAAEPAPVAPKVRPVSPGRLGAVNSQIVAELPSAIEHLARLAELAEDLQVRLAAAELILAAVQMGTPASVVTKAREAAPSAIASLITLATGRIPGAAAVAVQATKALVSVLRKGV